MKSKIKVAIAQYHTSHDTENNIKIVEKFLQKCKKENVELLVISEDGIASLKNVKQGYDAFKTISKLAKKYNIYLSGANTKKEKDGRFYNVGFLFDPKGDLTAEHKKICLSPPEIDEAQLTSGKELRIFNTELGKIGILVCKDTFNRYSAWLFQDLRELGVEIVIIPTFSLDVIPRSLSLCRDGLVANCNWTDAYFLVSGTIGKYSDFPSFGHAMVICPRRGILVEGSRDGEELLITEIDNENLQWIKKYDKKWQPDKIFEYHVKTS